MREMKDSGLDWLRDVPAAWRFAALKRLYSQISETGCETEDLLSVYLHYGVIRYRDSDGTQVHKPSKKLDKYQMVTPGNFVLNNQQAWRGSVGVSSYHGIVSPAYYVLAKISDCIDDRFANYLFRGPFRQVFELCSNGIGTIQRNLSLSKLMAEKVPLPPLDEQRRIADYLDEKCAEIDRAISAAEQSIEEYKAYKNSVIFQAVTKGLDKRAAMVDSGVEWLGEVPRGWVVRYPKFLFSARRERARAGDVMLTASQHHGMIPQKQFMEKEAYVPAPVEKGKDILKHVEPGDFVISMRSFQGGLEYSELRGKMSSAYLALYPVSDSVVSTYYRWLFKSPRYIQGLRSTTNLVRDGQALRYANFLKLWLPLPPVNEQIRIAEYLDQKCPQIDSAIAAKLAIIADLKAYKQSLIYEVVTGKREV